MRLALIVISSLSFLAIFYGEYLWTKLDSLSGPSPVEVQGQQMKRRGELNRARIAFLAKARNEVDCMKSRYDEDVFDWVRKNPKQQKPLDKKGKPWPDFNLWKKRYSVYVWTLDEGGFLFALVDSSSEIARNPAELKKTVLSLRGRKYDQTSNKLTQYITSDKFCYGAQRRIQKPIVSRPVRVEFSIVNAKPIKGIKDAHNVTFAFRNLDTEILYVTAMACSWWDNFSATNKAVKPYLAGGGCGANYPVKIRIAPLEAVRITKPFRWPKKNPSLRTRFTFTDSGTQSNSSKDNLITHRNGSRSSMRKGIIKYTSNKVTLSILSR
ncbi:hypothetical protein N9D31_03065 [Oligoflexaceae bacterium]|nr:hypothetical protein [Oligoflexaceae bacterium]